MGLAESNQVQGCKIDRSTNWEERFDDTERKGEEIRLGHVMKLVALYLVLVCDMIHVSSLCHAHPDQIRIMLGMLNATPWRYYPLTVQYLSSTYHKLSVGKPRNGYNVWGHKCLFGFHTFPKHQLLYQLKSCCFV